MKTQTPIDLQICSRCKAWRDCWTAPNGTYLCDECVSDFGLWCCETCNELAPQVSFIWIGEQHLCFGCYTKEVERLTAVHTKYLANNPDVATYLKPKEQMVGDPLC